MADAAKTVNDTAGSDNLAALATVRIVTIASSVLVQVLIARYLGREGFGQVAFLTSVTTVLAVLFHLGSDQLCARQIAREPHRAGVSLGRGMTATAALSVFGSIAVFAYVLVQDGSRSMLLAAAAAAIAFSLYAQSLQLAGAFQGLRRSRLQIGGTVSGRIVTVVATVALLLLGWGVPGVFVAQILGWLAAIPLMLIAFARLAGRPRGPAPARETIDFARSSLGFGAAALFGALYLASDVLILKQFHGDQEIGLYRGAAMFLVQMAAIGSVLTAALFPHLSRLVGDPERAGQEIAMATRVLLAIGMPVAVGGVLVAEPLVVFVLGEEFREAAPLLAVLVAVLPLRYLKNTLAVALTALDRQGRRVRGTVCATVLNVGANLILIPVYGALGAAAATLLTELALLGYLYWSLRGAATGVSPLAPLARSAVCAALMYPVILMLDEQHVLVRITAGAATYLAAAALSGNIRAADLHHLKRI